MHKTFFKQDLVWNKTKTKKAPDPEDKAWKEFSLFIRIRDALRTIGLLEAFRCVSCKKIVSVKGNDAGHYVTRGNKAIKYHPKNVHGQCSHCNRFLSGNVIEYRKNMIAMYGEDLVNELENTREIVKYVDWEEETVKWRKLRKALEKAYKEGKLGSSQKEIRETIDNAVQKNTMPEFLQRTTDNPTS